MAGHNESPRQKMVGMMYLVLTALLALNISKDVLNAFIVVNNGIVSTNENFTERNNQLYAEFNLAKSVDPVRVTPNWEKAQIVKTQSDSMISFIENLKTKLIAETDDLSTAVADTISVEYIEGKDNYDITTNIMIGESEDGSEGLSLVLKNELNKYKELLINNILPEDKPKVKIGINTKNPEHSENNENWELYNFYHQPLIASLTILSKMQNDIKNSESTVVDYLLKQVDQGNLKFDTVAAKVIPQSNYVLLGEEYKADLFLAAFNKTKNPEINVGNFNFETNVFEGETQKLNVENGVGKYSLTTNKEGVFDYSGTIKVIAPSGKEVVFPFKSEYIVAKPALTVSAEKMNICYEGLDNPVSISVPGVPNKRLRVSINKGTITPLGNGRYNVRVNSDNGNKTTISVVATMENGEQKNMGAAIFRVKRIPKPLLRYAQKTEGCTLTKGQFRVNDYLIAYYENFDFDIIAKVKKFTLTTASGGIVDPKVYTGNKLPDNFDRTVDRLKRGNKVMFEDVYAEGPDGREVKLNGLTFTVR